MSLRPRQAQAAVDLRTALDVLCAVDPGLGIELGPVGDVILKGQTEHQLESAVNYVQRAFKVALDVGAPEIAYRETITKVAETDYTHKEQSGGSGQFARIKIRWEPLPPGTDFVFENAIVDGAIPEEFIAGVRQGLMAASKSGVIAGFPCIDFKAVLFDGTYHDVDSSARIFEKAAGAAFREGIAKAGPVMLEPVMRVEVATPEDYMGDIIADLIQRRAEVNSMSAHGSARIISALVPLSNLYGYMNTLGSMSQGGHAQFTMRFDHYNQIPPIRRGGDDNFPMAAAL